jgi:hypothetical protein
MKFKKEYLCCDSSELVNNAEIREIDECVGAVTWERDFHINVSEHRYEHQKGYNEAFKQQFSSKGWKLQPLLCDDPKMIPDFEKNGIYIEVQFGNSATLYRDYYKFHYGHVHDMLKLAVLIVPTSPINFFPTRPNSIRNMAEFNVAYRYYTLLPFPVPILLIGLLPEN